MHNPFGDESPMTYHTSVPETSLNKSPFFNLLLQFMDLMNTQSSITLADDNTLIPETVNFSNFSSLIPTNPLQKDVSGFPLQLIEAIRYALPECVCLSGLANIRNRRITLSPEGKTLLDSDNHFPLFKMIFRSHYRTFHFDKTVPSRSDPLFRMAFPYFLFLVTSFGNEYRPLQFFRNILLNAYPGMGAANLDFRLRAAFVDALLLLYGFIEYKPNQRLSKKNNHKLEFQSTPLLHEFFKTRKLPEQLN